MNRHPNRQPSPWVRWGIAGACVALAVVAVGVLAGVHLGESSEPPAANPPLTTQAPPLPASTEPPPPAPSNGLQESFARFQRDEFGGEIAGLVVMGIGQQPVTVAPWTGETTAWSTIKVPLSIAALREGLQVDDDVRAALTVSDNAAAERIWAALGDGETAAGKVQAVLDDPATTVQAARIRPPYTPFGQTKWQLENQVRFLSTIACATDEAATRVLTLMGGVAADTWGLGGIRGTKFKGGWGPGEQSDYLVRQFGVLTDDADAPTTVVALIVEPGSFDEGTAELTTIAQWLTQNEALLPRGTCPAQP